MDNIKESKEYKLAKEWEMAVNSFSFNPKRFAAAIPDMHPTLQQSLYRLFKECIIVMADETRRYDCLLYTSPSPRDSTSSRMPSSA